MESLFSSSINLSFSFIVREWLEIELLFVRKGLFKFQNCLLFQEFLLVHFLKYCLLAFLESELHLFIILFIVKKFSLEGSFTYLCLHLDLFIISFLSCFVIKGASPP